MGVVSLKKSKSFLKIKNIFWRVFFFLETHEENHHAFLAQNKLSQKNS